MSRLKMQWRSSSRKNYNDFCKKHPSIVLSYDQWINIIYVFNESFRDYILETGERAKLPFGFGEFSIRKKKRQKIAIHDGIEYINLPIDWKKTREKGKVIYNFNYHTEGYFFGWIWFKHTARFKFTELWYFKPTRISSRLICHYLNINEKYQNLYQEWKY
jgi:hypothetical protein